MPSLKTLSVQKDYKLTPWNYEDFQEEKTKRKVKIVSKTDSHFFRRRNPSQVEKNLSYFQIYKQKKEVRMTQKCQREKPLLAKTINVSFDQQPRFKTLSTERLNRELQSFATQLTSRSHSKFIINLRLKNMTKSKTSKQLRSPITNFSQRNSEVKESMRSQFKRQMIVRSHNNFFQTTQQRKKSKSKADNSQPDKLLFSLRRNVIKDNHLKILIKNTQSTLLKQKT